MIKNFAVVKQLVFYNLSDKCEEQKGMNTDYVISCCSTADISEEHFNKIDVKYACFHYELDGKEYLDDLGKTMSSEDFYAAMARGADTKTSQINVDEFVSFFEPFLEAGKDILHISLSSGLSGVINSANIAKEMLEEKYPGRKLYVVDSLGASSGYGLIMDTLSAKRSEGMDIDSLNDWILEHRLEMNHWFFSTDLKYYVRGGRISKTSGFVGGMLGICPLLDMDKLGHLVPRLKLRGKNKAIHEIVAHMEKYAKDGNDYSGKCYISMSACYDYARAVADLVEEKFPKLNGKVEINNIGTAIGSHTGPGTVALFFWGEKRS